MANKYFKSMLTFKHSGTTPKDKNYIHEEIEQRLSSGNAWYHSDQHQLYKENVKIGIYKIII
jgi:hypothetical protein